MRAGHVPAHADPGGERVVGIERLRVAHPDHRTDLHRVVQLAEALDHVIADVGRAVGAQLRADAEYEAEPLGRAVHEIDRYAAGARVDLQAVPAPENKRDRRHHVIVRAGIAGYDRRAGADGEEIAVDGGRRAVGRGNHRRNGGGRLRMGRKGGAERGECAGQRKDLCLHEFPCRSTPANTLRRRRFLEACGRYGPVAPIALAGLSARDAGMTQRRCDIAIAGGGLAGGLIALALARSRPDCDLLLLEAGEAVGGRHRWSWFASDLDAAGEALLAPVAKAAWATGYDVAFPRHARTLATPYRSMQDDDFAQAVARALPPGALRTGAQVERLDGAGVTLAGGERITARAVIDCRGLAGSRHLAGGWQVFLGRQMRLAAPHGLARPVIMDARVAQEDGYRFVYLLPLGERDLFLEDTYYQDTPTLDRALLGARLDAYAAAHGWRGDIVAEETGVLPVITGGDFAAFQAEHHAPGVAAAGARGGFVHPLTSYTLPYAVQTALWVAGHAELPGDELAARLAERARRHWQATRLYRALGAMLFGAAAPEERFRVFERFYRLPQPLIERFYAARSTTTDALRILVGRPPVRVTRALSALAGSCPPLLARPLAEAGR